MPKSRTHAALKNTVVMVSTQLLKLVVIFVQRTFLIRLLSRDYLGIEGLFSNILSLLNLFELGVGSALVFAMYRPMAEGDKAKLSLLMRLYKRIYTVIGVTIIAAGFMLVPILPHLVKEHPDVPDFVLIYCLYVINTGASYFFVYKSSILSVAQDQYIIYVNSLVFSVIQCVIQVFVLLATRNYVLYFCVTIICTIFANLTISIIADRRFPFIREDMGGSLSKEEISAIKSNIVAMFLSRVGWTIQDGTDSLVISKIVGLGMVGTYSNYLLITRALQGLVQKVFTALTPSVGNLGATEKAGHAKTVFERTLYITGGISAVSACCLFSLVNPFISAWAGADYLLPMHTVILIGLMYFMAIMRRAAYTFDEAYGLFVFCRYKPLAESASNIIISIILARQIGIDGVLLGTIASQLLFSFWIEPYVLYKHAFHARLGRYMQVYTKAIVCALVSSIICLHIGDLLALDGLPYLMILAITSLIVSVLIYLVIFYGSEEQGYLKVLVKSYLAHTKFKSSAS